ncbi:fluoride efflux transporter FluC [Halobacterium bonnevillei]|uniref:Fluoride-specific ion channel FluC n=1 Tax=Halobacterium bonnevillei TaxID=2692200 RepID=A0A6B0SPW0_9EURY|nr:CrcB family protein [Halobacterium bonnevillei]MXR21671.1 chromosome condensation protein CrcB [Halobacterium bonnevillei]
MTSADPVYLVGAGASVGAVLRYATSRFLKGVTQGRRFTYGTFAVNVVGSFALGLVTVLGAGDAALLAIGTGACGSYTTFSSFSVDTVRLWEAGDRLLAGWYAAANLLGALSGIGAAAVIAGLVV